MVDKQYKNAWMYARNHGVLNEINAIAKEHGVPARRILLDIHKRVGKLMHDMMIDALIREARESAKKIKKSTNCT